MKCIVALLFVVLSFSVTAQHHCGSQYLLQDALLKDPSLKLRMETYEKNLQEAANKYQDKKTRAVPQKITVVVHIIHNGEALNAGTNIPDSVVYSQIDALNEDYNLRNADSLPNGHAFKNAVANIGLEFCLAQKDPNGNPTNGIIRSYYQTPGGKWSTDPWSTSFNDFDDKVKKNTIWDHTRYLNIWVCDLGAGLLGYASFPFMADNQTDGVVIGYKYFGYVGNALSPQYNLGRTAVHEIGHYLDLYHIWGDDDDGNGNCSASECTGTDYVNDTPNQCERNYSTPSFPKTDNCTPNNPGVMFMNYMDYVDDKAMVMFTKLQKTRMLSAISQNPRSGLVDNGLCAWPTPITPLNTDKSIQIYPNPATDILTIETKATDKLNIIFTDITGKQVSREIFIEKVQNGYSAHIGSLAAGVYFLKIQNGDKVSSHKFIKR